MTQCKTKNPAFVSRPHFYQADPSYLRQFQYGMRPDAERHGSSFWVEPESSIPVKVEMRLQLNVYLRKVEGIEYLFKNLQEVMFPVFWFEVRIKSATLTQLNTHKSVSVIISHLITFPVNLRAA